MTAVSSKRKASFRLTLFLLKEEALWVSGEPCPSLEGFRKEPSPWRKMGSDPTSRPLP